MISLLNEICDWAANGLAYWEQLALDRIVAGETLSKVDYEHLVQILLEDKASAEKTAHRPDINFLRNLNNQTADSAQTVRLIELSQLENVNALAPGQKLVFSDQLTVVYGANGSGKSGYARVLNCAGFSRGDRDILADIAQPSLVNAKRSARIMVTDAGGHKTIEFTVGSSCPELASFHAFDSTSIKVHLTDQNAISFSPPGLSHLATLANETDKCRDLLSEKIKAKRQPNNFRLLFQGDTEVNRLIASLSEKTNTKDLKKLAQLSAGEIDKISELERQIAKLKSEDVGEKLNQIDTEIADLSKLSTWLQTIEKGLSNNVVAGLNAKISQCHQLKSETSAVGIEQFCSEKFTQTGSSLWHQFIKTAKELARMEGSEQHFYPHAEDHCLLCRQALTGEARDLILRLWAYLENEAQVKLEKANGELTEMSKSLNALKLDGFNDQLVAYRHLVQHDRVLLDTVIAFFQSAKLRRDLLQQAIKNVSECLPPLFSEAGVNNIEAIVQALQTQRTELATQERKEEIAIFEKELLEMRHRAQLCDHLPAINEYISDLQWAARAEKARGNTSHLTKKQNELFEQRVTERYKKLFEQLLDAMGRPLKVHIDTKGKKGETFKQILLTMDGKGAKPDKVLSEGEKRAVAMADFLTEVILNEASSGIILDDPVTSLDSDWKDVVAQRLVNEARRRQVIIFTHDYQFLHMISRHAEIMQVKTSSHRIFRSGKEDRPGFIELDHSPIMERSYRDPKLAEQYCKQAENAELTLREREELVGKGFDALRASYEAFVTHDLFCDVIRRFEPNVSIGRLSDVYFDQSIIEEVIAKYGLISRFIPGHLPVDGFSLPEITPTLLRKQIEEFRELKRKLSKLKKC